MTVTVSMSGGCICEERGHSERLGPGGTLRSDITHHYARARGAAKVQFSVDVADVVPYWPYWPVERDGVVVLVE